MMSSLRIVLFAAIAAAGLTAADTANAGSIELGIDFRDSTKWGGHGDGSFSNGGITVDANGGLLYRDNVDGYGILGGRENDEVEHGEALTVYFEQGFFDYEENFLTGVLLTDLFSSRNGGNGDAGWVTLYIGDTILQFFVNALSRVPNGAHYLDFGGVYAPDRVVFTAYYSGDVHDPDSDYSVAGFTTVPEPAALFLMGVGLLMLGWQRRGINARAS